MSTALSPDALASRPARRKVRAGADERLALVATAALASGSALALGGAAVASVPLAVGGGAVAAAGLAALIAADLVSGVVVIALATPLPALYSSADSRIPVVAPVAALALVAWAFRRWSDRARVRAGAIPRFALAGLLCAFLLATLLAGDPLLALRKTLDFATLACVLVAATDELMEHPERADQLVNILAATAGVCGALAVLQAMRLMPGNFPRWGTPFQRAALGFGQPNGLGLFLVVLLPLCVYRFAIARHSKLLPGAAVMAATAGLAATFSRASWVALLAAIASLALARQVRLAIRLGCALLAAALVVEMASGGMLSDTAARTVGDWVVEQRAALFLAAVQMFLAHPLLGVGPGGFANQVEHYAARVTQLWDYEATPHNAYAQMAAEAGIAGLAAYIFFVAAVGVVLLRLARTPRNPRERALRLALLASFTALCVASFGIWPYSHGAGEAVILVLALALARESQTGPQP